MSVYCLKYSALCDSQLLHETLGAKKYAKKIVNVEVITAVGDRSGTRVFVQDLTREEEADVDVSVALAKKIEPVNNLIGDMVEKSRG